MNVLVPTQITFADIVSYNVPLDSDVTMWDVAVTYAKGDKVTLSNCQAVIYESVENNNLGNDPSLGDGTKWVKLDQPSNCYAMFDDSVGTQTSGNIAIDGGDIKIKLTAKGKLSGFAFLNVNNCSEVYVKVVSGDGVTTVYEETRTMSAKVSGGWWAWLFGGSNEIDNYIEFEFPPVVNGTLEVEFRSAGVAVKVGAFVYGDFFYIGEATSGMSLTLKDFSRFEEDVFGNYTIVPRRKSKRPSYPVIIDNNRFDLVCRTLESLSNKPVLWVADKDKFNEMVVMGFYRDLRMDFSTPAWVNTTLIITGTPN